MLLDSFCSFIFLLSILLFHSITFPMNINKSKYESMSLFFSTFSTCTTIRKRKKKLNTRSPAFATSCAIDVRCCLLVLHIRVALLLIGAAGVGRAIICLWGWNHGTTCAEGKSAARYSNLDCLAGHWYVPSFSAMYVKSGVVEIAACAVGAPCLPILAGRRGFPFSFLERFAPWPKDSVSSSDWCIL